MHCSRMLRLCAIPTALLLVTGVARGQVPATPDTTFGLPGNEPLDLSTPPPDESKHKTVNPFASSRDKRGSDPAVERARRGRNLAHLTGEDRGQPRATVRAACPQDRDAGATGQ
jgi:hypothetical protein